MDIRSYNMDFYDQIRDAGYNQVQAALADIIIEDNNDGTYSNKKINP